MDVHARAAGAVIVLVAAGIASLSSGAGAAEAGNAMQGKEVFAERCLHCHAYPSDVGLTAEDLAADAGGRAREGTPLAGLIGRRAGSLPGYFYSDAMTEADITWTEETLRSFVLSPRTFIRYNRMGFSGLASEEDAENLVAYLLEAARPQTD